MKIKRAVNITVISVLVLASFITALAMRHKISALSHENAAGEFSKGTRFAQLTLFIPSSAEFTVDKVMYFRYELEKKLVEKAVTPENEGARLYADAFFSYADKQLFPADKYGSKRSANAKMAYVGGDYGLFHAELRDVPRVTGDLNHDRILLSRSAAWQLFGGENLYGFETVADSETYYVGGVFADYETDEYESFLGDSVICIADIERHTDLPISVYEILIVNPVKDFAKNLVTECIDLKEDSYYLVENSQRFSIKNLFQGIPKLLNADSQLPEGVVITPEEASALKAENELSAMLLLLLIFALYPAVWLCILTYKLVKLIKRLADRFVFSKIRDKLSYS